MIFHVFESTQNHGKLFFQKIANFGHVFLFEPQAPQIVGRYDHGKFPNRCADVFLTLEIFEIFEIFAKS